MRMFSTAVVISLLPLSACFQGGDDGDTAADEVGESGSESGTSGGMTETGSESGTDTDTGMMDTGDETTTTETGEPECVDMDEDGYGENCENGPDCDDNDPYNYTELGCAGCKDLDMDDAWIGCDAYGDGKPGPDCDDTNPAIGADEGVEICNGLSENCAGEVDGAPVDEMCPADGMDPPNIAMEDAWVCEPPAPGEDGCMIKTCAEEWYDADADPLNGCECEGTPRDLSSPECSGQEGYLGVLGEGDAAKMTPVGSVPHLDNGVGEGKEDWYWVGFPEDDAVGDRPKAGVMKIEFVQNDAQDYRFEVYRQCGGAAQGGGLATQFGAGAPPLLEWSFADTNNPAFANQYISNVDWPEAVYIRVFRVAHEGDCNNYRLTVVRDND